MRFSKLKLVPLIITLAFLILSCSEEETILEPNNNPPVVTINTPIDNAIYFKSDTILFSATATDTEDGELTDSSLVWASHINGQLGVGDSLLFSSLSQMTHQIFLTATDSKGDIDVDTITLTIQANIPIVTIMSPADSSTFGFGDTVTFTGTAVDREDGVLTGNSLVWTSDKDGQIGTGTSFTTNSLSNGSHTITLTATDSHNNIAISSIDVMIINTWSQTFEIVGEERPRSVRKTSDGGYIIVGSSFINQDADVLLIKTDSRGNLIWHKNFGGADWDYGESVNETNDGGFVISGRYNAFGASDSDVYLIKTDKDGNLLWEKTFGGTNNDYGYSNIITPNGDILIIGETVSIDNINRILYLVKTDENGNLLWENKLEGNSAEGTSISKTSDNGYIIAGNIAVSGKSSECYLAKINDSGIVIWENSFGGTENEWAYSALETSDGGFILTGTTMSFGAGGLDVYVVKTDRDGILVWEKTFGGALGDIGRSIKKALNGGYIITGSSRTGESLGYLLKIDNAGNPIWEKNFKSGSAYDVLVTLDGGYIILNTIVSGTPSESDVNLIKTDSLGNVY